MLLKHDGTRRDLRSTGIVMGPLQDATFRRDLVVVEPGDLLLLYTDGVVERSGPAGEYGRQRLESHARLLLRDGCGAAQLCEALLAKAFDFGRRLPWADDATIVVILRQHG
jgi:sigma-B regulation protein RsbU (phosphoserine phosphatase)